MSWGFPALSDLLTSMLLAPERAPHQRREPGKLSRGFLLDLSGCNKPGLILPLPAGDSYPAPAAHQRIQQQVRHRRTGCRRAADHDNSARIPQYSWRTE